jgi:hypothetical protein
MEESILPKYGYRLLGKMPTKASQPMRLVYEPTHAEEFMTVGRFRYRRANGILQEVDKKIGISKYVLNEAHRPPHRGWNTGLLSTMGMKDWGGTTDVVKAIAVDTFKELLRSVLRHEDCEIVAQNDPDVNKGRLFGMIAVLKRFKFSRNHRSALVIWREGNPEYRFINENTIHLLELLLDKGLIEDANLGHSDYADSDKAMLFAGRHWTRIEIVFQKATPREVGPFDNLPRGGGFFPYILTDDYESLGWAGIYSHFDVENYRTNCVIDALKMHHVLDQEIPHISREEALALESILRTYTIPWDAFQSLALIVQKHIVVSHWCDRRGEIKEVKHYGIREWQEIKLFEREGHVMRNVGDIVQRVNKQWKAGKFRAMNADEMNLAIRARYDEREPDEERGLRL